MLHERHELSVTLYKSIEHLGFCSMDPMLTFSWTYRGGTSFGEGSFNDETHCPQEETDVQDDDDGGFRDDDGGHDRYGERADRTHDKHLANREVDRDGAGGTLGHFRQ